MKVLDRWIGMPVCFALTLVNDVIRLCGGGKPCVPENEGRVLFIELSEMGSMVSAFPAMLKALDLYPETALYFLTLEQNRPCIDMLKVIPPKRVITFRNDNLGVFVTSLAGALKKLRDLKIDVAVDFELFSRISAMLSYLSGAHTRVGYDRYSMEGLYRGRLLTHPVMYNHYKHISRNFMALIRALKADAADRPLLKNNLDDEDYRIPMIAADADIKRKLWERLLEKQPALKDKKNIYLLNPNAGHLLPIRAWPLDRYFKLAKRLLAEEGSFVIIMGTEDAVNDGRRMRETLNSDKLIDLTAQTKFEELLPLFELCDVLITNDSGPAHFASLTPIRILVFFGPETPDLYRPLSPNCIPVYADYQCSPCLNAYNHRTTICRDNKCLQSIGVDEVMEVLALE